MNIDTENVELNFKNLIKYALHNKISWPALKIFLDSATLTLKESKKLNNILLDELESMQSKQITNKILDETDSMIENGSLEKDVVALSPQNCEEDIVAKTEEIESEIDHERVIYQEKGNDFTSNGEFIDFEETSTHVQGKEAIALIQSDNLKEGIETENMNTDDGLIVGIDPEEPEDVTYLTHSYDGLFSEKDKELKVSDHTVWEASLGLKKVP